MNAMNQRDVQQHITILSWLYLVGHALFLVVGVFVFLLLAGIGVATGEAEAMTVLGVVGTAVGLLLAGLAIPGLLAGYGLLSRKPWARILAIVVGIPRPAQSPDRPLHLLGAHTAVSDGVLRRASANLTPRSRRNKPCTNTTDRPPR